MTFCCIFSVSGYSYGCETLLRPANISSITVGPAATQRTGDTSSSSAGPEPIDHVQEAVDMLQALLATKGRRLSSAQEALIAKQIEVEPTALYVRLALRKAGEP